MAVGDLPRAAAAGRHDHRALDVGHGLLPVEGDERAFRAQFGLESFGKLGSDGAAARAAGPSDTSTRTRPAVRSMNGFINRL